MDANLTSASEPKRQHPVSDWKARNIRVGWHIRNKNGQIGVVTWQSHGCMMYRMGTRDLNAH